MAGTALPWWTSVDAASLSLASTRAEKGLPAVAKATAWSKTLELDLLDFNRWCQAGSRTTVVMTITSLILTTHLGSEQNS